MSDYPRIEQSATYTHGTLVLYEMGPKRYDVAFEPADKWKDNFAATCNIRGIDEAREHFAKADAVQNEIEQFRTHLVEHKTAKIVAPDCRFCTLHR